MTQRREQLLRHGESHEERKKAETTAKIGAAVMATIFVGIPAVFFAGDKISREHREAEGGPKLIREADQFASTLLDALPDDAKIDRIWETEDGKVIGMVDVAVNDSDTVRDDSSISVSKGGGKLKVSYSSRIEGAFENGLTGNPIDVDTSVRFLSPYDAGRVVPGAELTKDDLEQMMEGAEVVLATYDTHPTVDGDERTNDASFSALEKSDNGEFKSVYDLFPFTTSARAMSEDLHRVNDVLNRQE